jgi:hypothetical protein
MEIADIKKSHDKNFELFSAKYIEFVFEKYKKFKSSYLYLVENDKMPDLIDAVGADKEKL